MPPSDLDWWLHVGYGNLSTHLFTYMVLDHTGSSEDSQYLQPTAPPRACSPWSAVFDIDLTANLDIEIWSLSRRSQRVAEFVPQRLVVVKTELHKVFARPCELALFEGRSGRWKLSQGGSVRS